MDRIVQRPSEADADALGIRIVELLAEVRCEEVTELPPLYDTVDTEAIEHLLSTVDAPEASVEVEFEYHGTRVTIDELERIVVEPN